MLANHLITRHFLRANFLLIFFLGLGGIFFCSSATLAASTDSCGPNKEFTCLKEEGTTFCDGPQSAYDGDCATIPGAKCCKRAGVKIAPPTTNPTTNPTTSADKNCTAKTEAEGLGPFSFSGALVPCGRKCQDESTPNDETAECTLCHLLLLGQNIFNLAKSLLILASILFLTIAGVILIVSTGDSGMKSLAKGIITKTLTGFALFMLAWLIVQTLLKVISFNSSVLKSTNWFEYSCDTTSAFNSATSFQQVQDGAGTGQTQPTTGQGLSADQAKARLDQCGVKYASTNTLNRIQDTTISEICNYNKSSNCSPQISTNGGTTGSHAQGECSHSTGCKLDFLLTSCNESYITRSYPYKGIRSDGAKMYQAPSGACYAKESDHWDMSLKSCPPPRK